MYDAYFKTVKLHWKQKPDRIIKAGVFNDLLLNTTLYVHFFLLFTARVEKLLRTVFQTTFTAPPEPPDVNEHIGIIVNIPLIFSHGAPAPQEKKKKPYR